MDDDRPFDATECYLCDASEGSMGKWRTTSLVTALRGILERKPQFEPGNPGGTAAAFRAAADELTHRGLDALALVRYGMWETVASSIVDVLGQSTVVDEERPEACLDPTLTRGGLPWPCPSGQRSETHRRPLRPSAS